MKKIDLANINNLELLKENFINVIDEHISREKNRMAISNADSKNVGELKYIFEHVSDKLYNDAFGKGLIKKYINTVKENKGLKNFYTLFETIKNVNGVNDSSVFLSEAIKLTKKIGVNEEKKLRSVVKEAILSSDMSDDDLNSIMDSYSKNIDKEISTVLLEKCTPKNILEYSNSLDKVRNMLGDRHDVVNESKESPKEIVDKLNGLVDESFEQWERDVIRDISLYTVANKDKSELFEAYKNDCINLIKETIENCESVEEKSRFTTMSENLLNKQYCEENFAADMLKLSELKDTLKCNL